MPLIHLDLLEAAKSADFEASEQLVVLETDLKARDNTILDLQHEIQVHNWKI